MMEAFQAAWADFRLAFRLHRVWIALAHEDIGDAHRRTALGPIWLLLNYLAFAGTFILLFHRGDSLSNGPAYIATGLFVWLYVSEVISQSIALFTREENFIKGTPLPLPVYVMRLTMQSAIRAIYTLLGCGLILLLSKFPIASGALWALPGMALILLMTPALVLLLAFVGAYFPDLQHIVGNLMRVGMFITPVFWAPVQTDGIRHVFYHYSPFTYMLELVRTPVLFNEPPLLAYGIVGAVTVAAWIAALQVLGRFRRELVFAL